MLLFLILCISLCYSQSCATNIAQCGVFFYTCTNCNCVSIFESACLNCLQDNGIDSNSITCWISANTNGIIYFCYNILLIIIRICNL
jgi:hypothetical protein